MYGALLSSTKSECASLKKQIELLQINERNMELNLVKNKMAVHKELEINENFIEQLEKIITELRMENKALLKSQSSFLVILKLINQFYF